MVICPLCNNKESLKIIKGPDSRAYRECDQCRLIFTEARFLPSEESEKKRYLTHKNGIQYKGYVNFLNRAIEPALPFLNKDMRGLDFGCGPSPTLSVILEQKGLICDNYDIFFFPDLPREKYDFIFATECFEHFFFPAKEIQHIKSLLKANGILIIMTETWKSVKAFTNWYYARDFTHVSFFHIQTFDFIAQKFEFEILKCINERVVIMRRTETADVD
ncbi:MAG: class I SAM-dependent methyltransferase [Bacteroidales bacterium]|nr:class I SAM-dependent methyltransferase [Bacteroidales bacterium]